MAPLFNLFPRTKSAEQLIPPKVETVSQDTYDDDYDLSLDDSENRSLRFLPRDNLKTNLACIIFACLSHYLYGIFFNAYESVNSRYGYPNIGSMCFVLATALILVRFDLSLKSLPIESRSWRYSVYKVLAVTFLTHLILAGIWQQLVNLTWEVFFATKDLIDQVNMSRGGGVLGLLSELMTSRTVNMLTHMEGIGILLFVLSSSAD